MGTLYDASWLTFARSPFALHYAKHIPSSTAAANEYLHPDMCVHGLPGTCLLTVGPARLAPVLAAGCRDKGGATGVWVRAAALCVAAPVPATPGTARVGQSRVLQSILPQQLGVQLAKPVCYSDSRHRVQSISDENSANFSHFSRPRMFSTSSAIRALDSA